MSELKNAISIEDRLTAAGLGKELGPRLIEGDADACGQVARFHTRLRQESRELRDAIIELERTLASRQNELSRTLSELDHPTFCLRPVESAREILARRDTLNHLIPLLQEQINANVERQEALRLKESAILPVVNLAEARGKNNLAPDKTAKELGYSSPLELLPARSREAYLKTDRENAEADAKTRAEQAEAMQRRQAERERWIAEETARIEQALARVPEMNAEEIINHVGGLPRTFMAQTVTYFSRPGAIDKEALLWLRDAYKHRDQQHDPIKAAVLDRLANIARSRGHISEYELVAP
jgi:hypothetical protein